MTGRTALVTGGAGGIGAEICRELLAAGHAVAVADLSSQAAADVAEQLGGGALGVELDVTDPGSVERAVAAVAAELGDIGICVNCAGWDEFRPFLDCDDAFIAKVLEVNLAGPMRVTRAVLGGMVERKWGRVISIASDAGRVGSSLESVYSGAKGGMIAFTKTIAREVARYGITANSVCPGPNDTPLLEAIVRGTDDASRVVEAMARSAPMRRLGTPEDVAPAVAFLASDGAGFITGQTLSVSGGLTMA